ncbi:MAG: DNRLRE domain-containing protein, partial [Planctomycetota bacterium]|nr:DNRLRE domain-containing protein [Planctomycetota bacterium]
MITAVAKLATAASLLGMSALAQSFPPVFTLQADRDVTLYESATGNLASGSGPSLFVGVTGQPAKRRALVRFDVAGNIPSGSKILGVGLRATSSGSSTPTPLATTLHRVLADWSEGASVATSGGGGGGGQALPGDATWLHSSYPSTLWSTAGGDFEATPSGALALVQFGLSQTGGHSPGLIADVQSWLDNPATNFGWLIKSDESAPATATRVDSRESLSGGAELTVTFLPPGLARTWGYGCLVTGAGTAGQMGLTLTGSATSGATVGLQYHQCPPLSVGATFYALELGYGPA